MPTFWVAHPFVVPPWGTPEIRRGLAALIRPASDQRARAERELAALIGRPSVTATGSGRLALEVALRAAGVGPAMEVIVPTFACAALVTAVRRVGAGVAFADVGPDLNVTPDAVAAVLTERTRAVVVVHAGGRRAPVEDVVALVRGRDVVVIEDCAQSLGGATAGVQWGLVGQYAIHSFGMGKNVMASAGGSVAGPPGSRFPTLRSEPRRASAARLVRVLLAYRLRRWTRPFTIALEMRARGAPEDRDDPYPAVALSEMDAAILRVQVPRLGAILAARRANALALLEELDGEPGVELPDATDHVFTKFYLQLRSATRPSAGGRAPELIGLIRALLRAGFEPELAYTPLHLRYGGDVRCPVAEDRYWRTLALPVRPGLSPTDCRRLGAAIRRYVAGLD